MLFNIGFGVVGVIFIILGVVMRVEKLPSLSFDFNYKNVKEADYEKYTSAYGNAYILTGTGMLILIASDLFIGGYYSGIGFFIFSILLLIATIIVIRTKRRYKTGAFH